MADDHEPDEVSSELTENRPDFQAPWPGDKTMPQWETAGLVDAPTFTIKKWVKMLGPGLILGGAAIGGGEWLVGPELTAKYGGALLWLGTLSIIGQVLYNLEISRYALYCGEPIFTGKFRSKPGKRIWMPIYMILDSGSIFPYLALTAAIPLFAAMAGIVPNPEDATARQSFLGIELSHYFWIRLMGVSIFLVALIPLIFGGKIHVALKWVMGFKIVVVMGFLLILAIGWSSVDTWREIGTGFVKFGSVPTEKAEDANMDGKLGEGEQDWDGDGHADVVEPTFQIAEKATSVTLTIDLNPQDDIKPSEITRQVRNADGTLVESFYLPDGLGIAAGEYVIRVKSDDSGFVDIDGDEERDGDSITNVFMSLLRGEGMPDIDWSMIATLSALVAISGSGGLSNTPISNYTRDEGWGMGHHVGAIPSMVGGLKIELSHQGTVFDPEAPGAMARWRRWCKHVKRDQLAIWLPACFIGLALPSMLSVEFMDRGSSVPDQWVAATMTAEGVRDRVNGVELRDNPKDMTAEAKAAQAANEGGLGNAFWFFTVFCGFLVLAPSMSTSADGIIRRWVDVFWTTSDKLRAMPPENIRIVYFRVLTVYAIFGLIMLVSIKPAILLKIATTIYNYALGISCLHTLFVNRSLLPKLLQPRKSMQLGLFLTGVFFLLIAIVSTLKQLDWI